MKILSRFENRLEKNKQDLWRGKFKEAKNIFTRDIFDGTSFDAHEVYRCAKAIGCAIKNVRTILNLFIGRKGGGNKNDRVGIKDTNGR